jgi:hypothetical protein
VRQLRYETTELFEAVFSMRSVPRCYKQDKSRIYSVVRYSPSSKDVNTEDEEATALEAVTRRQPVKIQQAEKTVRAVVNCRVCELAIAPKLLVVAICKCSMNPVTNPQPVYSHSIM